MTLRWNIILGIVCFGLLAWFYHLNLSDSATYSFVKTPNTPTYMGKNMTTVIYDPMGNKQYVAYAKEIQYFEHNQQTLFVQPSVYLYSQNKQHVALESWKLSANNARLEKNKTLFLTGNVSIENLTTDLRLQSLHTQQIKVDLTNQDIASNTQVEIKGQNFLSTGHKLTGNLKKQLATLHEQVKTHYEVNP